jgi:repressor LexA
MAKIGSRILELRKQAGLTQQELANKIGYKSKSAINKIELGLRDISQSKILLFANALNVTPLYLMGIEKTTVTKEETELISLINQLNEEEVKELYNYIDYIISKRK